MKKKKYKWKRFIKILKQAFAYYNIPIPFQENILKYLTFFDYGEKSKLFKGICPVCNLPVNHHYPMWTKNPEKYKDAKPIHEECYFKNDI